MTLTFVRKPKVFIASPLFNSAQHAVLDRLESLLESHGFDYYSARKHSGSDKLSLEEKKTHDAWIPVYESNEQGLNECEVMIAVVSYPLPDKQEVHLCDIFEEVVWKGEGQPFGKNKVITSIRKLDLPDSGTVFEIGYHRAQGKLVLSFFPESSASHLNLMMSHGTDGTLLGWEGLERFLASSLKEEYLKKYSRSVQERTGISCLQFAEENKLPEGLGLRARNIKIGTGLHWHVGVELLQNALLFDWSATVQWGSKDEEVE